MSTQDLKDWLTADALLFDALADKLDSWAAQSRAGGWSTHQVEANIETANGCRRQAAIIRGRLAQLKTEEQT